MSTNHQHVVTFGEIMARLATPGFTRLLQSDHLELTFGGGEANVAVSLCNFGVSAKFITRLPDHDIGHAARNYCRKFGVDTSSIVWGGSRVGIYFLETGASQRASKVIYDRAGSSIAEIKPGMVDWKKVFDGAGWFHWTGITPALSDSAADACEEALKVAKEMDIPVSVDLNYRAKLWSPEKAGQVMSKLVGYCDVAIGNEEDAEKVFGIKAGESDVDKGELDHTAYTHVAEQLKDRFGLSHVAITLRESISASVNNWSAMLYSEGAADFSTKYHINIVDRVGGGDSFAAGLIYALLQKKSRKKSIEFAVAASCLKHTIPGDFNLVSVKDVEGLVKGGGSGRVQR